LVEKLYRYSFGIGREKMKNQSAVRSLRTPRWLICSTYLAISALFSSCFATINSLPYPPEVEKSPSFDVTGEQLIGPGDVLAIKVMGQPDLSGDYKVSSSGLVFMPLIGTIPTIDQTPTALNTAITERLQSFIKAPNVSTSITQFLSQRVYFVGEWNTPGPYAFDVPTTLLEAIGAGGNLTRFASGRIVLIRKTKSGARNRYATNISKILNGLDQTDIVQLKRGDVIVAE
jgi:protein involved in polysaccharide export with SLBB domain